MPNRPRLRDWEQLTASEAVEEDTFQMPSEGSGKDGSRRCPLHGEEGNMSLGTGHMGFDKVRSPIPVPRRPPRWFSDGVPESSPMAAKMGTAEEEGTHTEKPSTRSFHVCKVARSVQLGRGRQGPRTGAPITPTLLMLPPSEGLTCRPRTTR